MAGRIRESDIAEVRDRNRIDEVIGEYLELRRAGAGALKGLCPFHDEKSPSFNVRPTHGTFHCFGCGEGGDVIAFLMKREHLSFVESVERLADRVGIRLNYVGGSAVVQRDRGTRLRLVEAHKAAAEFYAEALRSAEAAEAREFLKTRGFDEAAATRFGCGFAPSGWDRLTKHLLGRGFEAAELYKAGLAKEGRLGPIDRFHRRLLWPIKDLSGDVVGFGARRIFDEDPIQAKYVNTAESPIYRKSQVLFGLDMAKREIARRHQVVVVEGYTDVMAMHLAGVPTAVASCGTAFGDEHIKVLSRLLMDASFNQASLGSEVIFTFDGDAAGQSAARKAFDSDQNWSGNTFIAVAPDGMDPCELRQEKGDPAVRDLVARRRPLYEFAIRGVVKSHDLDTAEGQLAALRSSTPLVAQIRDVALRDEYARRLSGWVGWDDTPSVVREVRELAGGGRREPARPTRQARQPAPGRGAGDDSGPPRPAPDDPQLWLQREALKVALQWPALAGPVYDSISEQAYTHPAYLAVHRALIAAGGASGGLSGSGLVAAMAEHCPHASVRSLLTELSVESLRSRSEEDALYVASLLARLKESVVAREIAELKSRLQRMSATEEPEEYHALFGDLVGLEQYRKALQDQAVGGLS
ncbi:MULTISPECIES: DNA primase [Actinoalloteichus]|uniref:DNA primase n=1 Tax=Actinoalloteichus fjordicus TaxID=1612552 RepID=A0AAC9LHA9_9PSEU|nr:MULTISPECIES: DNA primase [Actinoalloteichus]APU16884.1 DNA primase, catalytic core [Actinoalloteichus fjordicus]APU22964.1 DNA primase, catalytic core [Actinoalloteichus sp. GBA129-24]